MRKLIFALPLVFAFGCDDFKLSKPADKTPACVRDEKGDCVCPNKPADAPVVVVPESK